MASSVVFRIEETGRLWCKFLEDYSRFEDWLKTAELTAANPDSADVLYTNAKEELKKFEVSWKFVSHNLFSFSSNLSSEHNTRNAVKIPTRLSFH